MKTRDKKPNVAIIVLDTLRKDTFDTHFDWLDGTRFENAWSTSHWTVPAHASLFTGQYASATGSYARSTRLGRDAAALPELLRAAGYDTRAFSSNSHISPYFGFDRGFDEFECVESASLHTERVPSRADYFDGPVYERPVQLMELLLDGLRGEFDPAATARRAFNKLYDRHPLVPRRRPTASKALSYVRRTDFGDEEFLFMNLMDVHSPYKPPLRYQSRLYSRGEIRADWMATFDDEADPSTSRRAYEDCASYLSDVLRRILGALDGFDWVIVLSDHGESFGESGVWGHPMGLHPELVRVPLVVLGPSKRQTEVETPVDLLDVFATVADLGGVKADTEGRSLLGDIEPRPCLTEYHGIAYKQRLERIKALGAPKHDIEVVDEPRFGLALAPDYYGYETVDGFESTGTADHGSPRELLSEMKTSRPDLLRSDDDLSIGEDVRAQLNQLGYM